MTSRTQIIRMQLLAGVASSALAGFAAGSARAADTFAPGDPFGTTSVNAGISINSALHNQAPVTASIANAQGKIGIPGAQTGSGNAVSANAISATALGNSNAAHIADLLLIEQSGAAALGYALNSGRVTASVIDSRLSLDLANMQSGAAANIGNSIAAATTLNLADTTVEGALPGDFVSTTSGSAQTGPTPLETHGTVLASSVQQAGAIGHTATADGNQIALRLISPGANTVAASPELVDNRIAAAFDGNSAGTAIALSAGGAPTFQGSAVVANVQTNSTFGTFGATTDDSLIEAAVSSTAGGATNRLNGGLAVKGNRVVSSATGNAAIGSGPEGAGNRITLGDGLSFDGPGAAAAGSSIGYSNLDSAGNTAGDLVVHNSQRNAGGGSLNARMTANSISATVDSLGGWIDLSGNAIAAAATGNAASNEVANGAGAATFAGTVAVASEQLNADINIISHNMTGKVSAAVGKSGVGSADTSSVAVGGNELSANSFGNRVSQSVSLEANTLALGNGNAVLSGGAPIFGSVSAGGAVTVTSLQRSVRSFTTATNAQSTIDLRSSDPTTADSSFTVDGNAHEAIAVDNDSDNGLSLAGTTVGTGAGLLNSQLSEGGVNAFLNGSTAAITVASADGTSLALTDNLQRVIAYGSNATNDIDVAATSIAVAPWSPMNTASVVSVQSGGLHGPAGSPKTQAAFALLNDQAVTSDVSAVASNPMLHLALSGTLTDSSAENDGNAIVAAAYGTDAANAIGLDAVGISAGTGAGTSIVAAVTNAQASDGDIRAGIDASAIGVAAIQTAANSVAGSMVSTSENLVQVAAYGNRLSENSIDTTATGIATAASPAFPRGQATSSTLSGGSMNISDAAFAAQNVQAASGLIVASLETAPDGPYLATTIFGGALSNSTVGSDANRISVAATANSADTGIDFSANSLATSAAVQNVQASSAGVTAESGAPLFAGSAPVAGVLVTVQGVAGSTISVDDNLSVASAIANGASNSLTADANTMAVGSGRGNAVAGQMLGGAFGAAGDYALANFQSAEGGGVTAEAFGSFGIRSAFGQGVTSSALSVSGNHQSGSAVANTAVSELELSGNAISAGAALSSTQTGSAPVEASSLLHLFAPAAASGTTIDLSDNSNVALAVMNDVASTLSVAGANIGPAGALPAHVALGPNATGDRVLANNQFAGIATVSASAVTSLYNTENGVPVGSVLSNGALTISGNSTMAEASANRAANTLSLYAAAILAGNAGLANSQASSAAVTAEAKTTANAGLAGGGPSGSLAQGSLALEDNSTTALARGNAATNVLNATAGAGYGNAVPMAVLANGMSSGNQTVSAAFGILNRQTNAGAVGAVSTASAYNVVLNGLSGSSVGNSGNRVAAEAAGNSAVNSVALTALGGQIAPAAISNRQTNSGAVSASVTGASVAVLGSGLTGGSTIGVTGNSISASAVGNSAVSVVRSQSTE